MYKSTAVLAAAAAAVAAPLPPLHSPSPHINSTISFLTSLSLNRIKDFPDYYKCEITSAASPGRRRRALITALSRASSCGLEVPLFINSSKNSAASLSNVMKTSRQKKPRLKRGCERTGRTEAMADANEAPTTLTTLIRLAGKRGRDLVS